MIQKMPGEYDDKFANLRVAYGFMYGHPGKKLLFMGQEFAQWNEWSEARSLDWNLLQETKHYQMQQYIKALNGLYQKHSAFYVNDCDMIGFEWISCTDAESSIISFIRRGATVKDQLLIICNFTPVRKDNYCVGVPCEGTYTEILNSDNVLFGGQGMINEKPLRAVPGEQDNQEYSLQFSLPPLSTIIFKFNYVEKAKTQK
jgi:1,4-alpha-glucan branching enzyme